MLELKTYLPNRQFWNIVKGIGIICVVLGHVATWSTRYLYLFHLPLFYFVSGYLFNENKYGKNPLKNVVSKLKSTYLPYVIIYLVIVLLHNVLYNAGLLQRATYLYTTKDFLYNIGLVFIGSANELMGATLWFLPSILVGSILLGFIVYFSRGVEKITGKIFLKILFQFIIVLPLTILGYMLLKNGIRLPANIEIVMTAMPFFWVGYLLRNYIGDIEKYLFPVFGLVFVIVLVPISRIYWLDFAFGCVYPYMYFFAFLGIYACLCLAKILNNIVCINKMIGYVGQESMIIMIFHFPILRIIDKLILTKVGDPTGELYDKIPVCFEDKWYMYFIIAFFGSLLIAWIWELIKKGIGQIHVKKEK